MNPEELARLERIEADINALHKRLSLIEQRPNSPPEAGAEPLAPQPADLSADPDAFLEMPIGGITDDEPLP